MALQNGKFQPCSNAPRCVSSQEPGAKFIEPLPYLGASDNIMESLVRVIHGMERAEVIQRAGNYLRAEFKTRFFHFTDDVEVFIDESKKEIHFKSSSRIGYYDFNTNRNRVERLKTALRQVL